MSPSASSPSISMRELDVRRSWPVLMPSTSAEGSMLVRTNGIRLRVHPGSVETPWPACVLGGVQRTGGRRPARPSLRRVVLGGRVGGRTGVSGWTCEDRLERLSEVRPRSLGGGRRLTRKIETERVPSGTSARAIPRDLAAQIETAERHRTLSSSPCSGSSCSRRAGAGNLGGSALSSARCLIRAADPHPRSRRLGE